MTFLDQGQAFQEFLLQPSGLPEPSPGGGALGAGKERCKQIDALLHRQVVKETRGLKLHTDAGLNLPPVPGDLQAEDMRLTPVGFAQPIQHLQGRRLAGAIGPQEAEYLPPADRKTEVIDRRQGSVSLMKAPGFDHVHADHPPRRSRFEGLPADTSTVRSCRILLSMTCICSDQNGMQSLSVSCSSMYTTS